MNKKIAQNLLDIQAVQINPEEYFTWTSGIQSPIYCDNRLTMSYPDVRENITNAFIEMIEKNDLSVDVIAGCATAGIPHAAFLADALQLPMAYIRSDRKSHGKENQIEGVIKEGQHVIVIEDLISTGGSAINAAKVVRDEGAIVTHVLAIFTYSLKRAKQQFTQEKLQYETITNFDHVVDLLMSNEEITIQEKQQLITWRNEF